VKRTLDRHAVGGKPVLVRLTVEQRQRLEDAVAAVRTKAKGPGVKVTLSGFVLDAAIEVANRILRK
jgi:uncharacterized protein (DUF1778 family)